MAFVKKMMGFPSDLVSSSTKLPSKRYEKIRVTCLQENEFFHVELYNIRQNKEQKEQKRRVEEEQEKLRRKE